MKSGILFNDGVEGPKTHAERAHAITGCGHTALLALVNETVVDKDADWLQSMLDVGVFSFSRELVQNGTHGISMAACKEMTSLLGSGHRDGVLVPRPDGEEKWTYEQLVLPVTGDFQKSFTHLVRHVIAEDLAYKAHAQHRLGTSFPVSIQNQIDLVLAGLMACACALDRHDLVTQIVKHRPRAAETRVDGEWDAYFLNNGMTPEQKDGKTVKFLPAFFALQFGSLECLSALRNINKKPLAYAFLTGEPQGILFEHHVGVEGKKTLDLLDSFDLLVPMCLPSVVQTTIEIDCDVSQPDQRERLANHSQKSINLRNPELHRLAPVFEAVGGFGINPTATVFAALHAGMAGYSTQSYGPVNWDAVFKPRIPTEFSLGIAAVLQAKQTDGVSRNDCDATLAGAIEHAVRDGAFDAASHATAAVNLHDNDSATSYHNMGPVLAQPMAILMAAGFQKSLLAMVKAGVDPKEPLVPGACSLVQMADARNPELAHALRTFVNRSRVLDLLDSMEEPKPKVLP